MAGKLKTEPGLPGRIRSPAQRECADAGFSNVPDWVADDDRHDPPETTRVLLRLRRDILNAKLKPGTKLSLKVLAYDYGVGMTPLREALTLLCGAGLVQQEIQRGFRVAPVSTEDLIDVASCRRKLETMALGLAVAEGDDAWRARVEEACERFKGVLPRVGEENPIDETWERQHRTFHFALISACGSRVLLNFCIQLYDRYDRYRRIAIPTKSLMAGTGIDHRAIADAAIAGDASRAVRMLDEHIAGVTELVVAGWPIDGP